MSDERLSEETLLALERGADSSPSRFTNITKDRLASLIAEVRASRASQVLSEADREVLAWIQTHIPTRERIPDSCGADCNKKFDDHYRPSEMGLRAQILMDRLLSLPPEGR